MTTVVIESMCEICTTKISRDLKGLGSPSASPRVALESAAAHFIQPHFMSCYDRAGQNDTKGSSLFKPNSSVLAITAD